MATRVKRASTTSKVQVVKGEIIPPGKDIRPQNRHLTPTRRGERARNGRRGPNKMTRVIKEATLLAAEQVGYPTPIFKRDKETGELVEPRKIIGWEWPQPGQPSEGGLVGYLRYVAITDTRSYCSLLAKILPTQITTGGEDDSDGQTVEEMRDQLKAKGISHKLVDGLMSSLFEEKLKVLNPAREKR